MKATTYGPCSSCGCDADRTEAALCRLCFELRDQFAMAALIGIVGHQQAHDDGKRRGWTVEQFRESTAIVAYEYADAMLAARGGAK